jgi:hypothetical protein
MKTPSEKLFLLGCSLLLICVGCTGPRYYDHNIIVTGKPAPKIRGPRDPMLQANLSTNFWAPQPFLGSAAEVGTVTIKSAGIQGWKDYHMNAQATGVALQHKFTSGPNLTIDLGLQSLTVKHIPVPLRQPSYMRVVIFLATTSVAAAVYERTNPVVVAQGKLVWNSDGWFEIHPQKTGDVQVAPILTTSEAEKIHSP